MKTQQWLNEAIAREGARVLDGAITRAEADRVIIDAITAHPEYVAEMVAALGVRLLSKWVTEHASSGDLFQAGLFEDLPAVLRVAPQRTAPVSDMTAADLDKARNMLWTRTENAMNGVREAAERERAAFARFYDVVRPQLSGDLTVRDVLNRIAAGRDALAT